jgi:hypothetical protein
VLGEQRDGSEEYAIAENALCDSDSEYAGELTFGHMPSSNFFIVGITLGYITESN